MHAKRIALFFTSLVTSLILFSGCRDGSSVGSVSLERVEDNERLTDSEAAAEAEPAATKADPALSVPVIQGEPVLELTYGKPFAHTIEATNDPLGYGVTNPPPWLKREGNTLKGHPSQSGEFDLVLRALNRVGSSEPFKLKIIVSQNPSAK